MSERDGYFMDCNCAFVWPLAQRTRSKDLTVSQTVSQMVINFHNKNNIILEHIVDFCLPVVRVEY